MKLFFYDFLNIVKKSKISSGFIEKLALRILILVFGLLIVIQTFLANSTTRTFLKADDQIEGSPLSIEEFLYKHGEIRIKLANAKLSYKLFVMVNGEAVTAFNENEVSIRVKDGDVIELDSRNLKNNAIIQVINKSDNIISEISDQKILIRPGISKLCTVSMK